MLKERIGSLEELVVAAGDAVGFMACVTLFDGEKLRNYLITKDFPRGDMLPAMKDLKDLVVENLETPITPKKVTLDAKNS
jgi:hypothetical protein